MIIFLFNYCFVFYIFISINIIFFFFFQAEDGIRDATVTGVQTCALPICGTIWYCRMSHSVSCVRSSDRSEERRVGKGVDLGGRRIIKKKKKKKKKEDEIKTKKISKKTTTLSNLMKH